MKQTVPAGSEQLQTRQSQLVADDRDKASESRSFVDNRSDTMVQRKLIDTIRSNPKMMAQRKMVESIHNSPRIVAQRINEGESQGKSMGNTSSVPGKVAQLITYRNVEYTRENGNIKDFHAVANVDLNKLDPERDVGRDKKMLNVIGNGEEIIESPQELLAIIHPDGKGYQIVLNNELKELSPTLRKIIELALGAHKLAPVMRRDSSTESHEYVIMNMVQIKEKTEDVKKRVQWKKLDSIEPLAETSIEKARTSMVAVLEYSDPSLEPSKQQIRAKEKQEKSIEKGIELVGDNAEKIAQTASEVEPELKNSADEQYLRGMVAAGPKGGNKHLTIGKKTATKPLLESNSEEAKGILWASVWSMGVNQAFIEGGTDSEHEFRLISPFPHEMEESLRAGDVEEFIRVAREGTIRNDGADPWRAYYHKDNKKLTTLGEEVVHLLKNGYVLE